MNPATSSIVPFNVDGAQYVFLYAENANLASIDALTRYPMGRIINTNVSQVPWPMPGGSKFAGFTTTGGPILIVYKAQDPGTPTQSLLEFHAVDLRSRPPYRRLTSTGWTQGWTDFIPFQLYYEDPEIRNRVQYIFYSQATTGAVTLGTFPASPTGAASLYAGSWSPGWTGLVPFVLSGNGSVPGNTNTYLLRYMSATGRVEIAQFICPEYPLRTLWQGTWASGWTLFVPIWIPGDAGQYVFTYGAPGARLCRFVDPMHEPQTVWSLSPSQVRPNIPMACPIAVGPFNLLMFDTSYHPCRITTTSPGDGFPASADPV